MVADALLAPGLLALALRELALQPASDWVVAAAVAVEEVPERVGKELRLSMQACVT
jgi:hypothetical protein